MLIWQEFAAEAWMSTASSDVAAPAWASLLLALDHFCQTNTPYATEHNTLTDFCRDVKKWTYASLLPRKPYGGSSLRQTRIGLPLSTNPIALSPSTISPNRRRLPRDNPVLFIQYITVSSFSTVNHSGKSSSSSSSHALA
jgi:hypothetical protein